MVGCRSVESVQENRLATALDWAKKWGHIVVLKGAVTVIASPDGRELVIPVATSALAHGGTGDVLAGIIAGLRAQDIDEAVLVGGMTGGVSVGVGGSGVRVAVSVGRSVRVGVGVAGT